jgi:hypothetical protein
VRVQVHRGECSYVYEYLCFNCVFFKKILIHVLGVKDIRVVLDYDSNCIVLILVLF